MNRFELRARLDQLQVRREAYSLEGGHPTEAYVLSPQSWGAWRFYYSERGGEADVRDFDSASAACEYLLALLLADPTTRAAQGSKPSE